MVGIRIGIIGCGAIGSALAEAIEKRFRGFASLAYVSDINPVQILKLRKRLKAARFRAVSIAELIKRSDFIIETASVKAAQDVIPKVLARGKDILTLSVGGILQIQNLKHLLSKSRGRVFVPSGGIAGVDAVLAARVGEIKSVRITTRKPLRSLRSSPYFLKNSFRFRKITHPTLIFKGNALRAVQSFPENVNVAATLSLAGIGPRRTQVQVFASPRYRYNMHEIEIEGGFGKIVTKVTNLPSKENPKTSALAVGSAIAALEKIFSRFKIGT